MANIVAILATTHHPFFYRASTAPPESKPDFADEWVRKVMAYRETLTRARPDVLVMVRWSKVVESGRIMSDSLQDMKNRLFLTMPASFSCCQVPFPCYRSLLGRN